MASPLHLTLYGYYKSSCTTRLRIALGLKGIVYESIYIDFFAKEQRLPAYAAVNPSLTLPTLVVADHPGPPAPQDLYITQSVAALEFLEDQGVFPPATTPSLLPATPADRARMRALVEIISGDTQPRAASHTLEMLVGIVGPLTTADRADAVRVLWAHDWHVRGFRAYDQLLAAGPPARYSVGDSVTLADVCLVPAVWNATERWGVQLEAFPALQAVYERLMALPAVQAAHWRRQPDCPAELREK